MIQKKTLHAWLRHRQAIVLLYLTHSTVHGFKPLSAKSTFGLRIRPMSVCRRSTSFTQAPPFLQGLATKTIGLNLPLLVPALPSTQSLVGWWYLTLLAIIFGAQPFFVKKYIPKTICRSTVVLAQEVAKFVGAAGLLWVSGGWTTALAGICTNDMRHCYIVVLTKNVSTFFFARHMHRLVGTGLGACCRDTSCHLRCAKLLHTHGLSEFISNYL